MEVKDKVHASSHWEHFGNLGSGWGTQRRADPADWVGAPLIALTSPGRAWVLRAFRSAREMSRKMHLAFTQDTVRQLCTLELLRPYLRRDASVLIIGDGFGVLGGLVRTHYPSARICLVDLSFTLKEQQTRLTAAFGSRGFQFVHAGDIAELSQERFDVAVNVASMQEMNPSEVARYFAFLRGRAEIFYCCNRESKTFPDGTRSVFAEYPWVRDDEILVDGPCPWHQFFFSLRFPFIRHYDGVHLHRLVRLARNSAAVGQFSVHR